MRLMHPDVTWIEREGIKANELVVTITRDEVSLVNNAINEALGAVEEWEFQTRVGVTTAEARALRSTFGALLREAYLPE